MAAKVQDRGHYRRPERRKGVLSSFRSDGRAAMARLKVGLVGCGFVAELHMYAYQRVYGVDVEVSAVAARGDHVVDFAKKHRIRTSLRNDQGQLRRLLVCR